MCRNRQIVNVNTLPNSSTDFQACSRFHQQGVSLVMLIFVIVIIGLLSTALVTINSQSSVANAHQVISTRAFFAAESGGNLQAMQLFPISGSGVCTNQTFSFSTAGLTGCQALTQCTALVVNGRNFYQVVSQGQCEVGEPFQATRTIEVRLQE